MITINTWTSLILVALAIIISIYKRYVKKLKRLPPGPIGLPFVGYLPFLGEEPYKSFFHLRKKYGNIIRFRSGQSDVIVLNEFNVMKEVLCHPAALDRDQYLFGSFPRSFLVKNGPQWVEERRFCMYIMRNLGFGKQLWETEIEKSVRTFIEEILQYSGKPLDITKKLHDVTANNIISFLIGRKFHPVQEKEKLQTLTNFSGVFLNYVQSFRLESIIPGLRSILEYLGVSEFGKASEGITRFIRVIEEEIEKHRSLPEYKEVEDFIKGYDDKIKHAKPEEQKHYLNDESLVANVGLFFLGSSDTVFSSLGWLIRLMSEHRHVQEKVQKELDDVIGSDGTLSYESRNQVPFTFAVIMESQRFSSIVPFSTTRVANQDFEIGDYIIPKGAMIMANTWGIHHDPGYWSDPELFLPERFLNDGKLTKNPLSFAPFSVGRRNCPGETMAYMMIFGFFTKIMQKFTISSPPAVKTEFKVVPGLVQHLKPQELCFVPRI